MKIASWSVLTFCLLSGWSTSARADVAPLPDASAGDGGEECTLTIQNDKWDNSCSLCTDADGGLSACQTKNKTAGKGPACTTTQDGLTVEIWCDESAASRAPPDGCAVQGTGASRGWGLWLAVTGIGILLVFRRRQRHL
jgi:MYXO-CTERM domain-containing protein